MLLAASIGRHAFTADMPFGRGKPFSFLITALAETAALVSILLECLRVTHSVFVERENDNSLLREREAKYGSE